MDTTFGQDLVAAMEEAAAHAHGKRAVVREGLLLVEEREAKLQALRETVNASIASGGEHSDSDVGSAVDSAIDAWSKKANAN